MRLMWLILTTLCPLILIGDSANVPRKYVYQKDISEHCRRRVMPSVFIGRRVIDANAQILHFSNSEVPYSCYISIRSESGNNIILVIQTKLNLNKKLCDGKSSPIAVYEMSETFGGYWGPIPDSLLKSDPTVDHKYYTIKTTTHATTAESIEEDTVTTTTETTTTHKTTETEPPSPHDYVEVEVPIMKVSADFVPGTMPPTLFPTDEVFEELYDLAPQPGEKYRQKMVPLVQFSMDPKHSFMPALRGGNSSVTEPVDQNSEPESGNQSIAQSPSYQVEFNFVGLTLDPRLMYNLPASTEGRGKKYRIDANRLLDFKKNRNRNLFKARHSSTASPESEIPRKWSDIEALLKNLTKNSEMEDKTFEAKHFGDLLKKIADMQHNFSIYLAPNLTMYDKLLSDESYDKENRVSENSEIEATSSISATSKLFTSSSSIIELNTLPSSSTSETKIDILYGTIFTKSTTEFETATLGITESDATTAVPTLTENKNIDDVNELIKHYFITHAPITETDFIEKDVNTIEINEDVTWPETDGRRKYGKDAVNTAQILTSFDSTEKEIIDKETETYFIKNEQLLTDIPEKSIVRTSPKVTSGNTKEAFSTATVHATGEFIKKDVITKDKGQPFKAETTLDTSSMALSRETPIKPVTTSTAHTIIEKNITFVANGHHLTTEIIIDKYKMTEKTATMTEKTDTANAKLEANKDITVMTKGQPSGTGGTIETNDTNTNEIMVTSGKTKDVLTTGVIDTILGMDRNIKVTTKEQPLPTGNYDANRITATSEKTQKSFAIVTTDTILEIKKDATIMTQKKTLTDLFDTTTMTGTGYASTKASVTVTTITDTTSSTGKLKTVKTAANKKPATIDSTDKKIDMGSIRVKNVTKRIEKISKELSTTAVETSDMENIMSAITAQKTLTSTIVDNVDDEESDKNLENIWLPETEEEYEYDETTETEPIVSDKSSTKSSKTISKLSSTSSLKTKIHQIPLRHTISWDNVLRVAPKMAGLLDEPEKVHVVTSTTKPRRRLRGRKNKKSRGKIIKQRLKSNRKKRYIESIPIYRARPRNLTKEAEAVTVEPTMYTFADMQDFAKLVEPIDDDLQGHVVLRYMRRQVGALLFDICSTNLSASKVVFLFNTSRIVLAINNFTLPHMSVVVTPARILTLPEMRCRETSLECQVNGARVCIDKLSACDGIPNCGSYDIYDEDRQRCGKNRGNDHSVYIAAFTFLAMVFTIVYAIHYWLKQCVPKVSEAFFIYSNGVENVLRLNTVMKSPLSNDDVVYDDKQEYHAFYDASEFKIVKFGLLKRLFSCCRRRGKEKVAVDLDQIEMDEICEDYKRKKTFSFPELEIRKIMGDWVDAGVQTGESLELQPTNIKSSIITKGPDREINRPGQLLKQDSSQTTHIISEDSELQLLQFLRQTRLSVNLSGTNLLDLECPKERRVSEQEEEVDCTNYSKVLEKESIASSLMPIMELSGRPTPESAGPSGSSKRLRFDENLVTIPVEIDEAENIDNQNIRDDNENEIILENTGTQGRVRRFFDRNRAFKTQATKKPKR